MRLKTASELVDEGSAMPVIRGWVAPGTTVEILPCEPAHGEISLEALQISARSPLGAIALETGGILIDDGWIRILGAGHARLARTIAGWNGLPCDAGDAYLPGAMFVADDALGGMFAVDIGALGATHGNVCFFDPGARLWRDTQLSYGDWLRALFASELDHYRAVRWEGWRDDVRRLPGTHAFVTDPRPWVSGPPLSTRHRRPITMRELRDEQLAKRTS